MKCPVIQYYHTDVELVWGGGGGGGRWGFHPITCHTEEAFVGSGATLSAPLFWLSLHAPVKQQTADTCLRGV